MVICLLLIFILILSFERFLTKSIYDFDKKNIGFSKSKIIYLSINISKLIWLSFLIYYLYNENLLSIFYIELPTNDWSSINTFLIIMLSVFILFYSSVIFMDFFKEDYLKKFVKFNVYTKEESFKFFEFLSFDKKTLRKEVSLNKVLLNVNSFISYITLASYLLLSVYYFNLNDLSFVNITYLFLITFIIISLPLPMNKQNIVFKIEFFIIILSVLSLNSILILIVLILMKSIVKNSIYETSMNNLIEHKELIRKMIKDSYDLN